MFEVLQMPAALPQTPRLPYFIKPAEDEALVSWVARLSAQLDQSPLMLSKQVFDINAAVDPQWWRRPSRAVLSRIIERTGIEPKRLLAMTFVGWAAARGDEEPERFAGRRWQVCAPCARPNRRVAVCPQCLAEAGRPYVSRYWMLGWAGACPRHRCVLMGHCQSCALPIRLDGFGARALIDIFTCRKCGECLDVADSACAHGLVLTLQEKLVAAKSIGTAVLPGIGELDWPTMMTVADMLLGAIWSRSATKHRQCLCDRIARDVSLSDVDRSPVQWNSNYGSLLMLGWMFQDMPGRLPAMLAILRAPRFDRLLRLQPDITEDMARRLRIILAPAVAKRTTRDESWRPWLDSLPESASDLRQRAASERYKHRRQRLTAFAALKQGASLAAAAQIVQFEPRSVSRWLQIGAAHGLEAALEQSRRKHALTAIQAETLAQWIVADRRHESGRLIIEQAAVLFGIALPAEAASNLLARHRRPKPGHRRRLWKPTRARCADACLPTHDPVPRS
jgi:transposase